MDCHKNQPWKLSSVSEFDTVSKSEEQAIIRIFCVPVDDYKSFAPSRDRITFEWLSPLDNDDSTIIKQQWFQSDANADYAVEK